MNALYTTLIIALLSALIATILGTAAAIGIQAMRKKMRTVVTGVTNIPMLNADIVTGISLMLLFIACRFSLGFKTILIAHSYWGRRWSRSPYRPFCTQRCGYRRTTAGR